MRNQPDFLVVFDLEFTAWEGSEERLWSGPDEDREIIQFGAVSIRLGSNIWQDGQTFEMYVRPKIRPNLSLYIKALTGITQDTIDQIGKDFVTVLHAFRQFVPVNALLCSNGRDDVILLENCTLHGIDLPFERTDFVNVRPFIMKKLGIRQKFSSSDLVGRLGLSERKKHDALSDALTVAETLARCNWRGFF